MRLAVAALLAGCSYSPARVATDAVPSDDAAVVTDGPRTDAVTLPACTLAATGTATEAAILGGTGGDPRPPATCPTGELPIGLGFDVSEDPIANHNDQIAMVNVQVRCGRVARDTGGVFRSTPTGLVSSAGLIGGNCDAYTPTVAAAEMRCPDGTVLAGVAGNRLDDTLYNTVVLRCATLAPDGAITTTVTALPIAGTGAESNQPQTAACPAGTAVSSFGIRSGCGHDQLAPRCAPVICE